MVQDKWIYNRITIRLKILSFLDKNKLNKIAVSMYKTYFDIAAKNFCPGTSNIDKIALVGDSNSTIPIEFVFVCND